MQISVYERIILMNNCHLGYTKTTYFSSFLLYINADVEKGKLCMKLFSISCRFRSNEPTMLARGIYRVRVGKLLGRNLINGTRFVWCYSRCRRPLPFPPSLLQIWTEFKLKVSRTFSGRFQHTRLNPELIKFGVWH